MGTRCRTHRDGELPDAQRSREGDEAKIKEASTHVYEALTHHFGPRDLGAHDPVVMAIAEYGAACWRAGLKV